MTGQGHDSSARIPVYILAGGKSRRFGSDKARAPIEGTPAVVRLADLLAGVAVCVTVVADRDGRYADLGLKTVGDIVPEKGPIGGLLTAVDDNGPDGWVFVTACDCIGIRPEWIHTLLAERSGAPPGAKAVVFRTEKGFEPLFGVYHGSLRSVLSTEIDNNRLKMQDFLDKIETVAIAPPDGWEDVVNRNRPVD